MNRPWIVVIVVLAWSSSHQPLLAEVIWRGDFETGDLSQWRGAPKSDAVHVVTDIVREGRYAVRIDGTNAARRGDRDRIEFQHQPAPPGTAEGTERYFGWSVYLPQAFSRESHAVGYFESRNSWRQLMSWEAQGTDLLFTTRVPYARRWQGSGRLTPGAGMTSRFTCSGRGAPIAGSLSCGSMASKSCPKPRRRRYSTRMWRFFNSASCVQRVTCLRRFSSITLSKLPP